MKTFLLYSLLFMATVFHSPIYSESTGKPTYYCKDESSWQQWHALLEEHPDDDAVYSLYALRLGLCSMVEAGNIDKDRAVKIFEGMRDSVIRQQKESEPAGKETEEGV